MFTCEICNYSTTRSNDLTKHENTQKHNRMLDLYNTKRERKERYNFICNLCNTRFPQKRDLDRHMNRQTPCVPPSQIQNIETQNITNNVDNHVDNRIDNSVNNTITYNVSIDFGDLRRLCITKDDQFLLSHIENHVEDISSAQERFDYYANKSASLKKDRIMKDNEFEEEFAKSEKRRGVDYTPELTSLEEYHIDLTEVVINTFFDNDYNHLSLFRKPHIQNSGDWVVKHASKAFDPEFLFNLVSNCPEKDHFRATCFKELDYGKLANTYKESLSNFLTLLDRKRNGFNTRTLHS